MVPNTTKNKSLRLCSANIEDMMTKLMKKTTPILYGIGALLYPYLCGLSRSWYFLNTLLSTSIRIKLTLKDESQRNSNCIYDSYLLYYRKICYFTNVFSYLQNSSSVICFSVSLSSYFESLSTSAILEEVSSVS